ncbi:MAG: ROK family protein [Solirubrobacteraceae bacterium]
MTKTPETTPASHLPHDAAAGRVIGVDVGGTKMAVAVLDGTTLHCAPLRRTDTGTPEELIEQIVAAIRAAGDAVAVGVAVPSVVDFETGRVRSSVNIPLTDVPLRAVLRERLGVPVFVDNDATCAALAEAYDDEGGLLARHLVMLTVGTGVGGGIVINGRIYRGATGAAAEIGHTAVGADLREAPFAHTEDFPQPGSLESLASGQALNERARAYGIAPGTTIDRARDGDTGAIAALELLGRRLGVGIANVINTFDPDHVVIGGGVSAAGDLLLAPAREEAARFTLTGVGTRTQIRQARYGPEAGVRGAALLAAHELEAETSSAGHRLR